MTREEFLWQLPLWPIDCKRRFPSGVTTKKRKRRYTNCGVALARRRQGGTGLAGEAGKDGFASRSFDEVKGCQSEQDEDPIGEPGLQSGQVEPLRHMVDVQKLEDVEVQQVEAIAALAYE